MAEPTIEQVRLSVVLSALQSERDSTSSRSKWVDASLFAMNGAAIVSLVNIEGVTGDNVRDIGQYFAAGLFLALFSGWLSSWASASSSTQIVQDLWNGELLKADDISAHYRKKMSVGFLLTGLLAGLLALASVVSFVVGTFAFANLFDAMQGV